MKEKQFESYSINFDKTRDVTDSPQLATFIRGVDKDFNITEELLNIDSLRDTTKGEDIFNRISTNFNNLNPTKFVSITSDGGPNMIGCEKKAVNRIKQFVKTRGMTEPVLSFQCIIYQEELCLKNAHFPDLMKKVIKIVNKIKKHSSHERKFKKLLS